MEGSQGMAGFNNQSRTVNAIKTSIAGGGTQVVKVLLGFLYRSLFLHFLSAAYLGINGLFTNILQVLSLAELGVTTAIVYRFYEPISRNDIQYVGQLMNFFRRVYLLIAGVILTLGLLVMPFIQYLIKDTSEIPSDVNLYLIFGLFLANTLSSYLFTYKLSLLTADQKNYYASLIELVVTLARYGSQLAILIVFRDYTLTLAVGILTTLTTNYLFSVWVTKQYKEVFSVKGVLPKEERAKIYKDTRAVMYHKVGTTVLTGTDNAVLTKMVSLTATGLYSNYALVITNIQQVLVQVLGNLTASVGNALNMLSREDYYQLFKRTQFICLWASSVVVVTCYISIDDLIRVCFGEQYVFDHAVTIILCILLYITITRTTNGAFINADGLFVKDRIRPLIEAATNLFVSIVLTKVYGIAGVFLGTIISSLTTIFWREPLLLYRYSFKRGVWEYWSVYIKYLCITLGMAVPLRIIKLGVHASSVSWLFLIAEAMVSFAVSNIILVVIFRKTDEFNYLIGIVRQIVSKLNLPQNNTDTQ